MKVLKYSPVDCQRAGCIEVKDSGSTIPKEFNDEKICSAICSKICALQR